ncbi:MAG: YncE family protein [Dysgonamonadaceae bacterium]|jgi:YVTN family beta-propeller protein|nr:YncE family protein [Dysgonamonadaceae bacterium]
MKKSLDLLKGFLYFLVITLGFTACEGEDPVPVEKPVPGAHGVFILNEGSWGGNNAGLSYHAFETNYTFSDILNGKLGDTGQDIIAYGSKLYIAVSKSKYIKVIDLYSQASLDSIPLQENGKALAPRYLTSYNGNVYVTTSDPVKGNVLRIDTTSFQSEIIAKVGAYPEGIAALNGKLYVANSGYGTGNTVSVIDLNNTAEEKSIIVGHNPYIVRADQDNNRIYLTYQGDYGDDKGGIQEINPQNGAVTKLPIFANRNFTIVDGRLYYFGITYNADHSANCTFGVYNLKTKENKSIISDETEISIAYGIGVNPLTKDVYISDTDYTNTGFFYVFGTDGNKKGRINAGISPNNFVFY